MTVDLFPNFPMSKSTESVKAAVSLVGRTKTADLSESHEPIFDALAKAANANTCMENLRGESSRRGFGLSPNQVHACDQAALLPLWFPQRRITPTKADPFVVAICWQVPARCLRASGRFLIRLCD
jgi:hypothetical protein